MPKGPESPATPALSWILTRASSQSSHVQPGAGVTPAFSKTRSSMIRPMELEPTGTPSSLPSTTPNFSSPARKSPRSRLPFFA